MRQRPEPRAAGTLLSFQDQVRSWGRTPASRLVEAEVREASADEAAALELTAPAPRVVSIVRVRLADQVPMAVEYACFPPHLIDLLDLDLETGSLHRALHETGRRPTLGSSRLTAQRAGADGDLLHVPADEPLLVETRRIDHSLLRPELTTGDVRRGCEIAARREVASVCVRPSDVELAAAALAGSGVLVGTVAGFPHGDTRTAVKVAETRALVEAGADEIDMVLHIGRLRSGDTAYVHDDIAAVVAAAQGRVVKVILENAYLTDEEKTLGCRITERAGAGFVKTSTGFAPGGATLADIRLMRAAVSPHIQVKAAGGVRSPDTLLALHDAGATRFGATATEAILDDLAARERGEILTSSAPGDGY